MKNYMRGYSGRTRRRRASYKKTNTLYANSYRGWGRDRARRRKKIVLPILLIAAFAAGLVVLIMLGVRRNNAGNSVSNGTGTAVAAQTDLPVSAVSPAAAKETGEESKGAVSSAVRDVKPIDEQAISKPKPKPRAKAIALTFDDGPHTSNTPKILSLLKKYNAHATFFVVGNRVASGADLLKKELEIGCEIANHSWNHANLSKMKTIKQVDQNLNKTKRLVKKLTGYDIRLTRPPYGAISKLMRKKLNQPMILWSVDTLDWKSRNAKAVFKQVKKQVSDGAIILVHDIHESTAEAMETVLPWLVKNDYDILTVSELMQRKGIKMKNGKAYCDAG